MQKLLTATALTALLASSAIAQEINKDQWIVSFVPKAGG